MEEETLTAAQLDDLKSQVQWRITLWTDRKHEAEHQLALAQQELAALEKVRT